ncbi:hypothetical protein VOLCADRAFT_106475 [Volvox carteri f. nagariensis]|uniref:Uncharacterized protein n=1 Tax=Volvox carteri f. nagariensis TaxID=3068 RepID=D8U7M7_VOLCA|nr:uncharacterized protein VOLCADRAFT_106475 [Volvox carteri f. nagariensis]EFJ44328.1 hypothetical protein VOLCADRAFT_106475 [Volvox carteri f. nagariensis]|eukprot:XP_002954687.1 hypothetical protein VOLCADRAFT_106475 [Volvox carteri f. nagariensis]
MQPPAAAAAASLGIHHHLAQPHLLNDISDVDFGLATCLATPMDPGKGLRARLAPLPATTTTTTTAAARNAAYKLTSANDVLQEASRYGDWVRRQERRRKLEKMQRVLSELGAHALLGRLLDDTTLPDMDSDPCWDPDAANLRTQRQRQAQEPQEFPHSGGCGGEDNGGNGAVARPRPPLPPPPQQQQQQQLLAGLQPGGGDAFGIRRGSGLQALGASRDARELDRLFRDDMALKN